MDVGPVEGTPRPAAAGWDELEALRRRNAELEAQVATLLTKLEDRESGRVEIDDDRGGPRAPHVAAASDQRRVWDGLGHGMDCQEIARYSRQIILKQFGAQAQASLLRGSVLVVGAGGLGSPALLYLAAMGVGRLGIVDHDAVDESNLHRQVLHGESWVGLPKPLSARAALKRLNSRLTVEAHCDRLTPANAVALVRRYDVVVDASDNALTRYLVSDACCVAGRPLISGAAIGTEGQCTVYHYGEEGPCYRCLFPEAPAAGNCQSCAEAGVLGVVPGTIGCFQALEAVKILAGRGETLSRRLLIVDFMDARVRCVRLRARNPACVACGEGGMTARALQEFDYCGFVQGIVPTKDGEKTPQPPPRPQPLRLVPDHERVQGRVLQGWLLERGAARAVPSASICIVDVRPAEQFAIGHLPGALSAPFASFDRDLRELCARLEALPGGVERRPRVVVVCRRGNDSQRALVRLKEAGVRGAVDLVGGMEGWATNVDESYPLY